MNFSLNKIVYLLVLAFPVLLITGPFLPDLIIVLTSLIFIYISIIEKNFSYFKSKIFFYFCIFYFIILISCLINYNNINIIKTSVFYLRFGIFILVIQYVINTNENFFKNLNLILFLIIIILFLDSSIQLYFGYNLIGIELLKPNNNIRASSFFGSELILGSYTVRILPLFLITYLIHKKNKYFPIKFILIFLITFLIIIYSGERTAFIMWLFIFLSVFFVIKLSFLKKTGIFCSILFTFCLFFFLKPEFTNRLVYSTINQVKLSILNFKNTHQNELIKVYYSEQHQAHVNTALQMFLDRPIIGHGAKSFRYLCDNNNYKIEKNIYVNLNKDFQFIKGCSTHPHNLYAQLLAEVGILGFLVVFIFFLYFFVFFLKTVFQKIFIKNININNLKIYSAIGIIINLLPIIPFGNFFNNWMSCIMYYSIFIYLNVYMKNK